MKYYSRSPEEISKNIKTKQKPKFTKKISYIILLVDIVIILAIFLYYSHKKDISVKRKEQLSPKEFYWNGWKLAARCRDKKKLM